MTVDSNRMALNLSMPIVLQPSQAYCSNQEEWDQKQKDKACGGRILP